MTDTASAVAVEKSAAENGWTAFLTATSLIADLEAWEETTAEAGVLLSARVSGPQAEEAVRRLAARGDVEGVGYFHQAQLDYRVPGRVACVWQSNGVWVELWAPDVPAAPDTPAQAAPQPVIVPSQPARSPRRVLRPSGRLPFTRRSKTPKETPTV